MDMRTKGVDACRRVLLGQPLRNVVNDVHFPMKHLPLPIDSVPQ